MNERALSLPDRKTGTQNEGPPWHLHGEEYSGAEATIEPPANPAGSDG